MNEFGYYKKLSDTQRGIEANAALWQAHLKWDSDVQNALSLSKRLAQPELGSESVMADRVAQRRHEASQTPSLVASPNAQPHF